MATENNKNQIFTDYNNIQNTVSGASPSDKTTLVSKSNTILGYIVSDLLT